MRSTTSTSARAALSQRLLRFAADRTFETRDLERRMVASDSDASDPEAFGYATARAALAAARTWEAVVVWVAWRLQPRTPGPL